MCLVGDTLYVADTENHAIRAVDLKAQAGHDRRRHRQADRTRIVAIPSRVRPGRPALNSPWDLVHDPGRRSPLHRDGRPAPDLAARPRLGDRRRPGPGSGIENILDGPADAARFAQPSGLATDGEHLFVADSEVSGVRDDHRASRTGTPIVRTIVGKGLFEFGDHDGQGAAVRLQHCLGVAYGDGHLYIADTYNNKIKVCDPEDPAVHDPRRHRTSRATATTRPQFYEPGGLSVAGIELYVADTNNHKIRVVDLKTHAVRTLELAGISAPPQAPRPPELRRTRP